MPSPLLFTDANLYLGGGTFSRGDLLVRDGLIAALGPVGSFSAAASEMPGIETVAMHGRTLLPGFQDSHVHPPVAGMALLGIDLSPVHSLEGYRDIIARAAAAPDAPNVLEGVGWYGDLFPSGSPTAAWLDAVVPHKPVVLTGHDGHSMWLNTAALKAADITRDTPDPADGVIVREPDGTPSGTVLDGAMRLATTILPSPAPDVLERSILAAQAKLHSVGITAWQDAMVGDSELGQDPQPAYAALAGSGQLTARVAQALWWDRERGLEQIDELVERRASVAHLPGVTASVVKVMQDGMVENQTAALLSPYCRAHGHGAGSEANAATTGPSFIDPELLTRITIELERRGFDLHFHGVGDRGVRECLDAVQAARKANGPTSLRHQIAHVDLVDPADIARFTELGVGANLQMLWARRDEEIVQRKLALMGAGREPHHFPFGALQAAGAFLAAGSDWPVSAPDPLLAVHTGVHRTAPAQDVHAVGQGVLTDPLEPQHALTLGTALDAYLTGSARANRLETTTGALRVGMQADLVALDADLETAEEIGAVRAARTVVGGRTVFDARA